MSCGLRDVLGFEGLDRPAVLVASSVFTQAADDQVVLLGAPGLARVHVPHPIQDRTDEEMVALADGAYEAVLAAVTADPDMSPERH